MGPRARQYSFDLTDAELDKLVAVPPVPVALSNKSKVNVDILGNALANLVVPDSQMRQLIRHFLGMAQAHAIEQLDTDEKYIRGGYSKKPWGFIRRPAVCFTGLHGVGKSQLLRAVSGILASRATTFSVPGHSNIGSVPMWMTTLENGDGLNQLLRQYIDPDFLQSNLNSELIEVSERKNWSVQKVLTIAAKRSWFHATCLMVVDEFQWISASSSANTRAATVLLKLHGIGPLLVFGANFSLGLKLKARPPEERDRLMSYPVIMQPFGKNSSELTDYLIALKKVAPQVFIFDPVRDQEQIYLFTYGIRRKIVDLLMAAYRISSRTSELGEVGTKELLVAYRSELYVTHREDVEVLLRQQITGKMEKATLWCPFGSMNPVGSNVKSATQIVQAFEKRVEDALLEASLMPVEVAAMTVLKPDASHSVKSAKVLRFRKEKATKETLLAGAAALDEFNK